MFGIDVYENHQSALLVLKGGVDALTVAKFRHLCDDLLARGVTHFLIDLSQTQIMDSAGIAVLVYLFKQCRAVGGAMKINNTMSPAARRILRLTRFDRIFDLVDIHQDSFGVAGNEHRTLTTEQAKLAPTHQPDQQLHMSQNSVVVAWQNSLNSQLQLVHTTLYNALQSFLNTAVGAFMQRVNRQFSLG
jgi:anti-sigma B factor antagonist